MNSAEIRNAVLATLKAIAPEVDAATLSNDQPLRAQIDLDSMDWLNVILGLHERLKVDIPESDYGKLGTMNEIVAYLSEKLP
jgi:acyl carrier protein